MQKTLLILFSIYAATKSGAKCNFERLVKECFDLSPADFSFSKYPNWPDARKLDRPLRKLRQDNLILGDLKDSIFLTKSGKKLAEEVAQTYGQRKLFK